MPSEYRTDSGDALHRLDDVRLGAEEERTVRKPTDKVIAPVLLDNPVLSHADIIPRIRLLYQFYCINKLCW